MRRTARFTARAWLSVGVLAFILGLVPMLGTSPAQAQDSEVEGEVTLMAYAGVFKDNYVKAVVEPCMAQYPGIEVTYQEGQNSAQMLAQLRTQKDDPQVDVVIMDVSIADTGNQEGLFQPLDPAVVTNLADLYDDAKVADNYGPSVTFDNLVLIYNTELVETPPTSWNVLWEEEYAGKVIIPAPPDIQGLALTIITNNMEGADYKETIDPAIERLAEVGPNVLTFDPQPDQYTIVTSGDAALAVGWNARAQLYASQSEGKMAVVLPDEGSVFQKNTINLVNETENAEAAQVFINCALSAEMQASFAETMYYAPVNKNAKVSEEVLARTASSPELVEKMIPVDWAYVATVRDDWLERWRREVISG
jgi:putative spermidine/putrescine transport system substrate-binding protein